MRAAGSQTLSRRRTERGLRKLVATDVSSELTQDCIDEGGGGTLTRALNKFNTLIDCGPGGNAAEPTELVNGKAECNQNLEVEPGEWLRGALGDPRIKQGSPTQNAHDQFRRQRVINQRETVVRAGVEQF